MRLRLFCILFFLAPIALRAQDNKPFRFDTLYVSPSGGQTRRVAPTTQASTSRDQTPQKPQQAKTRNGTWHLGGNIGMGFGDYTNINIAPQIGYSWNRYFMLGGGVSYNYYDSRDYDYTLNYLGANFTARVYPVQYLTFYVQPEIQHRWGKIRGEKSDSETLPCLLLGGGVVIPTGGKGSVTMSIYYDVLQERYSPYGNKLGYSVGYNFSF